MLLPFFIVVNVDVEAVSLAWVNVVPNSEIFGEVAALALGAVADVGHVLTFRCLGSSRRFDGLKRVSGTLTRLRDFRRLGGLLRVIPCAVECLRERVIFCIMPVVVQRPFYEFVGEILRCRVVCEKCKHCILSLVWFSSPSPFINAS